MTARHLTPDVPMPMTDGEADDLRERMRNVEQLAGKTSGGLDKHEAVCAERYKGLTLRLNLIVSGMLILTVLNLFGPQKAVTALFKFLGVAL